MEDEIAVGIKTDCITRSIEQRIKRISRRKRIGNELLRCQFGQINIALRDTWPADHQFSNRAGCHWAQLLVENVGCVIRDWPADCNRRARLEFSCRRHNSCFGWPIGVQEATAWPSEPFNDSGRASFTAQDDDAQVIDVALKHRQKGRHSIDHCDAFRFDHVREPIGLFNGFGAGHFECGADGQRHQDLFHGEIKRNRRLL